MRHHHRPVTYALILTLLAAALALAPVAAAQPPDADRQPLPGTIDCQTAEPIPGQTVECLMTPPAEAGPWALHWVVERADGENQRDDVRLLRPSTDARALFRIYRAGRYTVLPRFIHVEAVADRVVEGSAWPLTVVRTRRWYRDWRWWATVAGGGIAAGVYCSHARC